jgi:mRNA interferase YafQ
MKTVHLNGKFKKDLKLAKKRGKDVKKMQAVVELLAADRPLPHRCHPHKLSGEYADHWECRIEPDWLLIFQYFGNELWLTRLGTHSDLFD